MNDYIFINGISKYLRVCDYAVFSLKGTQDKKAISRIVDLLKDEAPQVRSSAVYVLGRRLQAKEAIPQLIDLLKDGNYDVSSSTANVLEQYNLNILEDGLLLALSYDNIFVRKKSISVVGYYSNEEAEKKLPSLVKTFSLTRLRAL